MNHPVSSSMLGWFSPLSTAATNATASSDSDAVTASLSAASVASALSAASSSPSSAASSSGARAGRKITADVQSDLRQMIFWISSAALLLVDVQDDAEKSSDSPPSAPTSDLPRAVNLPRTKTVRNTTAADFDRRRYFKCSHISDSAYFCSSLCDPCFECSPSVSTAAHRRSAVWRRVRRACPSSCWTRVRVQPPPHMCQLHRPRRRHLCRHCRSPLRPLWTRPSRSTGRMWRVIQV